MKKIESVIIETLKQELENIDSSSNYSQWILGVSIREEGKGVKTVTSYTGDIKGFLDWLLDKGVNFKGSLIRFYITSYKEHLLKEGYTVNIINKKINSLHCFNHYLIMKGLCSEKVVYPEKDKIKVARGSEGEVLALFAKEELDAREAAERKVPTCVF